MLASQLLVIMVSLIMTCRGTVFHNDEFSLIGAERAARFSHLSYPNHIDELQAELPDHHRVMIEMDAAGFVGIDRSGAMSPDPVIVVSYKGTDTPQELISNADMALSDDGIHRGFDEMYTASALQVNLLIITFKAELDNPVTPILFTGHSKGGALAMIAAVKSTIAIGDSPISVYTLGAPRAGTIIFANQVSRAAQNRVFRIVNGCDVVPTWPYRYLPTIAAAFNGRSLLGGSLWGGVIAALTNSGSSHEVNYHHSGKAVHLKLVDQLVTISITEGDEVSMFEDCVAIRGMDQRNFEDHMCDSYLHNINQLVLQNW